MRSDVDFSEVELEYENKSGTRTIGELDYVMSRINGKHTVWIFELKSSRNPKLYSKALLQLDRAVKKFIPIYEERFGFVDRVCTYYVRPTLDDKFLEFDLVNMFDKVIGYGN